MGYAFLRAKNEKAVIRIEYDNYRENPREWDNLGTMIFWNKKYNMGDNHNYSDKNEFLLSLLEECYNDYEKAERKHEKIKKQVCKNNYKRYGDYERAVDDAIIDILGDKFIIIPVYMYEHSGVALNTCGFNCPWDSGQVGWIYVSKDKVRKEYNVSQIRRVLKNSIINTLQLEIEVYSHYLNGDVFGFVLEDLEGNIIDSCWGFYGYDINSNGIAEYIPSEYKDLLEQIA